MATGFATQKWGAQINQLRDTMPKALIDILEGLSNHDSSDVIANGGSFKVGSKVVIDPNGSGILTSLIITGTGTGGGGFGVNDAPVPDVGIPAFQVGNLFRGNPKVSVNTNTGDISTVGKVNVRKGFQFEGVDGFDNLGVLTAYANFAFRKGICTNAT